MSNHCEACPLCDRQAKHKKCTLPRKSEGGEERRQEPTSSSACCLQAVCLFLVSQGSRRWRKAMQTVSRLITQSTIPTTTWVDRVKSVCIYFNTAWNCLCHMLYLRKLPKYKFYLYHEDIPLLISERREQLSYHHISSTFHYIVSISIYQPQYRIVKFCEIIIANHCIIINPPLPVNKSIH